jgi:1-acyl-sn-glycerol-3-phosphate acyltransferase
LEIKGQTNLKKVGSNAIFACNHSSEMDVFMLPGSWPFFSRFSPAFYTSRERDFYKNAGWRQRFYGGAFFNAWGAYPVSVGLNDYGRSLANQVRIVNDGGNLCIFPEGRTTKDGNLQKGKGGVAYLSHATGRPIIPVYIGGTFGLSLASFLCGKCKLSISYGDPIYVVSDPAKPFTHEMFKEQAEIVMQKIAELKQAS